MAALQQVLFAIGQLAGTTFLEPSYSALAPAISLANQGAGADLFLTLFNNGVLNVIQETNDNVSGIQSSVIKNYNWLSGGTTSLYSVRIIRNSGELDFFRASGQSDLIGSWLPMTQTRSWLLRATAPPNLSVTIDFTLQIARTNNLSNILSSGTFNFTCSAQSFDNIQV